MDTSATPPDGSDGEKTPDLRSLNRLVTRMRLDTTTGELLPYPTVNTVGDVEAWSSRLERDFKDHGIPKLSWPDAAILFLADPESKPKLNIVMRQKRDERNRAFESAGVFKAWDWEVFLEVLKQVLIELDSPSAFTQFQEDHPTATKIAKTGLVVAGATALTPVVVIGGLNALGFTAAGVAGGSIAAGLQSVVYGGATTGIFSVCQSIAATGAVPAIISAASSLVAGASIWRGGDRGPDPATSSSDGADREDRQADHGPTTTVES